MYAWMLSYVSMNRFKILMLQSNIHTWWHCIPGWQHLQKTYNSCIYTWAPVQKYINSAHQGSEGKWIRMTLWNQFCPTFSMLYTLALNEIIATRGDFAHGHRSLNASINQTLALVDISRHNYHFLRPFTTNESGKIMQIYWRMSFLGFLCSRLSNFHHVYLFAGPGVHSWGW